MGLSSFLTHTPSSQFLASYVARLRVVVQSGARMQARARPRIPVISGERKSREQPGLMQRMGRWGRGVLLSY